MNDKKISKKVMSNAEKIRELERKLNYRIGTAPTKTVTNLMMNELSVRRECQKEMDKIRLREIKKIFGETEDAYSNKFGVFVPWSDWHKMEKRCGVKKPK